MTRQMATLRCPKCGDTRVDVTHAQEVVEIREGDLVVHSFDPDDNDPCVYLSCAAPLCHTQWIITEHWREKP